MKKTRKRNFLRSRALDEKAAKEMVMPEKQQADTAMAVQSWQMLPSYRLPRQQTPSPSTLRVSSSTPQIAHGCLLLPVGLAFWWYWTKRTARRVIRHLLPSSSSTNNTINKTTKDDSCLAAISCSEGGQKHFVNDDSDSIYVSASHSTDQQQQQHYHHHHHHQQEEEKGCSGSFSSGSFDHFESWEDVVIEQDRRSNHLRLVQWIKGRNHFGTTRRMRAISKQTLHRREKRNHIQASSNVGDVDNLRQRSMPMLNTTSESSSEENHPPHRERPRTPHDWQCIEDVTGFELCKTDYQQQQQQQKYVNVQPLSISEEGMHSNSCYGCPS